MKQTSSPRCCNQEIQRSATLQQMEDAFLRTYPDLLSDVRKAVLSQDAEGLQIPAYSLKGMIGNFQVSGAFQAASELEALGIEREMTQFMAGFQKLRKELERSANGLRLMQR